MRALWRVSLMLALNRSFVSQSQSYIATYGQSVSQSVSLGVEPQIFIKVWQLRSCFFMGLPLEREDGSVICICCWPLPAQSFSVRVPWDSQSYFTLSDLRLPFSSPPTTRRVQCRAEQINSLLPATSQHGHSWHRAPLGPMAIYLFNVKTLCFFFRCFSFDKTGGVGLFFYNWCSLTTPFSTRGHIKVGDIYILYNIHKTQTDTKFYYI
jgi:hypothetical protein